MSKLIYLIKQCKYNWLIPALYARCLLNILRTVQIIHNLNSLNVSHTCPMCVTQCPHFWDTHVTCTQQTQKHAWKSYMRLHTCKILHMHVKFYTRVAKI